MNFLAMLDQCFLYPIRQLLELYRSDSISEYLFDGEVTLWQVIVVFFVGALLIRFLLSPVRLRLSSFGSPNTQISAAERMEDNRLKLEQDSIVKASMGEYHGKL